MSNKPMPIKPTNQNDPKAPRYVSTAGSYSNAATTEIIRMAGSR